MFPLLGHDLRWKMASALAQGDFRVNELVERLGRPQNLISYHLAVLKRSGLLTERRSSADARDVYYHLDLNRLQSQLQFSFGALRPGLESQRPARRVTSPARPLRVLFICTGNSARSQLAEALLRRSADPDVEVWSAGPRPAGIHPLTIAVLEELGLPLAGLRSKCLGEVSGREFELVITLCDIAREECRPETMGSRHIHWSLPDPAEVRGSLATRKNAFRRTAAELERRIDQLFPVLTRSGGEKQ